MMKRLLCLLLICTLFLPSFSLAQSAQPAASGEELHLLWGIPFGISMDEVMAQIKDKTMFELEPETDKAGVRRYATLRNDVGDTSKLISNYMFYRIHASFYHASVADADNSTLAYDANEQEAFNHISVQWRIADDETPEYAATVFADLMQGLEEKYGPVEYLYFVVAQSNAATHRCKLEKADGVLDTAPLIRAMENKEERILAIALFNNISLTLRSSRYNEYTFRSVTLVASDEGLTEKEIATLSRPDAFVDYDTIAPQEQMAAPGVSVGF